jgi:hypothetical protein
MQSRSDASWGMTLSFPISLSVKAVDAIKNSKVRRSRFKLVIASTVLGQQGVTTVSQHEIVQFFTFSFLKKKSDRRELECVDPTI